MACSICFDFLFRSSAASKSGTGTAHTNNNRIAALSCGHTFHLDCIKSWEKRVAVMNCPMCSVRHIGSILVLYIDPDVEHNSIQENGSQETVALSSENPPRAVKSPRSSLPLYLDRKLVTGCKRLKDDVEALRMANRKGVAWIHKYVANPKTLHHHGTDLENREQESKTLPGSYKAYIRSLQSTLELLKQAITEMESDIRHAYPEST